MFVTDLAIRKLGRENRWELLSPLIYYIDNLIGECVEVPKGFVTDFASIPFPFSRIFPPVGKSYDAPSVLHDYLYYMPYVWGWDKKCRQIERVEADNIYLEAMVDNRTPLFVRRSIYAGLRMGGWVTWNRYRKGDIIGR